MNYLIRAALLAISMATITPVANAATPHNPPAPVVQETSADWANG